MKEFNYTITDPVGIHARPAKELVKFASQIKDSIKVKKGAKECDMKKLLALMGLGAKKGDTITVIVEGENEEKSAADLEQYLKDNF